MCNIFRFIFVQQRLIRNFCIVFGTNFTEPAFACVSSKIFCSGGRFTKGGIGFPCVKSYGTKFFAQFSPDFRNGTPASILLSQTAFVTPRPRATVRIVFGTLVAEKGGIGSQARVEPATAYSAGGSLNDLFAVGSDTVVRSDLLFHTFNTPLLRGRVRNVFMSKRFYPIRSCTRVRGKLAWGRGGCQLWGCPPTDRCKFSNAPTIAMVKSLKYICKPSFIKTSING